MTQELVGKVDALSVSMNAQDEMLYNRHCRPQENRRRAYAAMEFARLAKAHMSSVT